jgi:lipoprotein-anchoring transpeptidase ErfK/SrfK
MIDPFQGHSHGCINMYKEDARQLWKLTARTPMSRMKVTVYGRWS